jgi:hypothetical protein
MSGEGLLLNIYWILKVQVIEKFDGGRLSLF